MTKILFIGRFQPLHNGHVSALKQALSLCDFLLVGIGSSQAENHRKNPFSYKERKRMLELALKKLKVSPRKYRIIPIPDFPKDSDWIKYVLGLKGVDLVYSSNRWVKRCLKGRKPVKSPRMLDRLELRATLIRKRMKTGQSWSRLVPEEIRAYLASIKGTQRVRSIYS